MNRDHLAAKIVRKYIPGGNLLYTLSRLRKLNDRQQRMENELEESQTRMAASVKRLSQLIKNLNSGILVEDEERKIVLANQLFCDLFSIPADPNQLTGMDCAQSAELTKELFVDPEGFIARIDEILRARVLVTGDELQMKDGRVLVRDFIPVYIGDDWKGHLWKYEDVTQERERQLELHRLSMVASANENGVLFTDSEGRITWANEGFVRLTGYTMEEIIGCTPIGLCRGPLSSKESLREMLDAFYSGKNFVIQVIHYRKDGSWFWGKATGQSILDDKGRTTRYFAMFEDITRHKLLELDLIEAKEDAEQSSRAKEAFLANMSHEIRTPLNAILGMSRQLGKTSLDCRQQRYLETIRTAGEHLLVVINDILDISKIEAGQLTLEHIGFNLADILERTAQVMLHKAEEKGLQLDYVLDPRISPVLLGDPYRLNQVLLNLISNAIKFTDRGSVNIRCTVDAELLSCQTIRIEVQDSGIGMEKEFLSRLFRKFQQEDRSAARKFGGTGLGMSICKQLTDLMKGAISVSSVKGEGTTVQLIIPFETGRQSDLPLCEVPEDDNTVLRGKRVLLVEDNEMNRFVATTILQGYGVLITEAVNGAEAVEMLRGSPYDLVLMDLQMPVMNGMEATRAIRDDIDRDIPIIALTANAIKGENQKCLAGGMNAYVAKPFEEKELIAIIAHWLKHPPHSGNWESHAGDVEPRSGPLESRSGNVEPRFDNCGENAHLPLPDCAAPARYDLKRLRAIGRDDEAFINRMLQLFAQQAPAAVTDMSKALEMGDGPRLHAVAHRLKPMLHNLGIDGLAQDILDIETLAKEDPLPGRLAGLLANVSAIVDEVIGGLNALRLL